MARALTHTRTHTGQPYARVSRLFAAIPLLSTCPASRQPASPVQLPTLRHRVRIACACRSPLKLVAIAWRGLSRRHARFYFVVVFLQCVCVYWRVREWSANSILRGRDRMVFQYIPQNRFVYTRTGVRLCRRLGERLRLCGYSDASRMLLTQVDGLICVRCSRATGFHLADDLTQIVSHRDTSTHSQNTHTHTHIYKQTHNV